MLPEVPRCYCGHAAQVHTPDPWLSKYLQPGTPRGSGPCTANRCPCDGYVHKPVGRSTK